MQRAKQHGFFHLGAHLNSCSKSAAGFSSASTHRCLQGIRQICYFFPYHQLFAWLGEWRTMPCDAGRVMVPYAERAAAAGQDAERRGERARRLMGRETIGGFAQ